MSTHRTPVGESFPTWPLAERTRGLNASQIREILKTTEQPGVLSLAGGLPASESFPVQALSRASERLWQTQAHAALQYASSEGLPALRQWLADRFCLQGWRVQPQQILITTGSQQGLDLLGKVLMDPGSPVLVEQPTFLGALQAFSSYQPAWATWQMDAQGPMPEQLRSGQRAAYLVPNYQNPTGRCLSLERRQALLEAAARQGVPLIEDDPYGELWFDQPPPPSLAMLGPEQVIYLGSFSKVLAPGLRLGYVVCPRSQMDTLGAKLLQAKQATDLHTPGLNQRLVMQLLQDGFGLDRHLDQVRALYRAQRDAMARALRQHLPPGFEWTLPSGGMFFWIKGPEGFDASVLLQQAIEQGVAFVPGSAFHVAGHEHDAEAARGMRLSFVTLDEARIAEAVARLGQCLRLAGTLEACH
jgi:2-aminoadipate transaminase